jgi:N-acetylglucosamine transport system substrate-binding protein
MKPVPPVATETKQPASSLLGSFGGDFIVPVKSKTPNAGKEIIRILLSKKSAQFFAENVSVPMPVKGIDLGKINSTAFKSANEAADAAKGKIFNPSFARWYSKLSAEVTNAMGAMLRLEKKPDEFLEASQKGADEVAKDPTIKKFKAEPKDYPA